MKYGSIFLFLIRTLFGGPLSRRFGKHRKYKITDTIKSSINYFFCPRAFLHIKYIKQYERGERSPHLRPFEPNVWLTITLWLFISGICVAYIDNKIKERNFSIIDSIYRSFESFTNQCE